MSQEGAAARPRTDLLVSLRFHQRFGIRWAQALGWYAESRAARDTYLVDEVALYLQTVLAHSWF